MKFCSHGVKQQSTNESFGDQSDRKLGWLNELGSWIT